MLRYLETPPLSGVNSTAKFILPQVAKVTEASIIQLQILPKWAVYEANTEQVVFYIPEEAPILKKPKIEIALNELHSKLVMKKSRKLTEKEINAITLYCSRAILNARIHDSFKKKSLTDDLTGLLNRYAWEQQLTKEINRCQRTGGVFSIVFFDIDNFKIINDTFGHLKGDETLEKVAKILRDNCRSYDVIGRYGGDEFIVLLTSTNLDMANLMVQRVDDSLTKLGITMSSGIAVYPTEGLTAYDLLRIADEKMYANKRKKKNSNKVSLGGNI